MSIAINRLVVSVVLILASACQLDNMVSEVEQAEMSSNELEGQSYAPLDILLVLEPFLTHLTRKELEGPEYAEYNRISAKYAERDRQTVEVIKSQLETLPDKLAGLDYRLALIGDHCIQPPVTSVDPKTGLMTAFDNIIAEYTSGNYRGPGTGVAGGKDFVLTSLMTGLNDYFRRGLSYIGILPELGTRTGPHGRTWHFAKVADGVISQEMSDFGNDTIDGEDLFIQYENYRDGLLAVNYYDNHDEVKCNRPWLRQGSTLAMIVLATYPSDYRTSSICRHYLCTMPDIEWALRDSGHLTGTGSSLAKNFLLYGITDKENGVAYNAPSSSKSQRAPATQLRPFLASQSPPSKSFWRDKYPQFDELTDPYVDWHDFVNYRIEGSTQRLAESIGDINTEEDYQQIFDEIVTFAKSRQASNRQSLAEQPTSDASCQHQMTFSPLIDVASGQSFSFTIEIRDCNGMIVGGNAEIQLSYRSGNLDFRNWQTVTATDGNYKSPKLSLTRGTTGYQFHAETEVNGQTLSATSDPFDVLAD